MVDLRIGKGQRWEAGTGHAGDGCRAAGDETTSCGFESSLPPEKRRRHEDQTDHGTEPVLGVFVGVEGKVEVGVVTLGHELHDLVAFGGGHGPAEDPVDPEIGDLIGGSGRVAGVWPRTLSR